AAGGRRRGRPRPHDRCLCGTPPARGARAIPAPMLYERAPHTGGATAVPSPSAPWHLAQLVTYTRAPAVVSAVRAAHVASRLDAAAGATGTSRERNHR